MSERFLCYNCQTETTLIKISCRNCKSYQKDEDVRITIDVDNLHVCVHIP